MWYDETKYQRKLRQEEEEEFLFFRTRLPGSKLYCVSTLLMYPHTLDACTHMVSRCSGQEAGNEGR